MSGTTNRWDTHWDAGHNWALILAAGEGSRLQALTMTASGIAVPKQFCSLGGGESLLHAALARSRAVAPPERTCAVVAEHHRRWWKSLPLDIPADNLIPQPRNRGTANGILLPLLHIMHRDPEAMLLVLPSDHYVRNETVMATSLQRAMIHLDEQRDRLLLLGLTPEEPDPELGYIVAEGDDPARTRAVSEFIEKPSATTARALIARGALWNSFIFAARGQALLRAFEARCPDIVGAMRHIITGGSNAATSYLQLRRLYEGLPHLDFSRDVLQASPALLEVLTVPPCGWSDLGTPRRVGEAVDRCNDVAQKRSMAAGATAFLDLAAQYLQTRARGYAAPASS